MNNNQTILINYQFIKSQGDDFFSQITYLFNSYNKKNSTEKQLNDVIFHFSYEQRDKLIFIARILSGFSILGLLFVLSIFIFCRNVRSFVLELAVWLCATNLFFNICNYFPNNFKDNNNICVIQGLISSFSDLSTMIWTTLIGFFSFYSVVKSGFIEKNKKTMRLIFIAIAYFIPGFFTLLYIFLFI
jgi:hypothetical protein